MPKLGQDLRTNLQLSADITTPMETRPEPHLRPSKQNVKSRQQRTTAIQTFESGEANPSLFKYFIATESLFHVPFRTVPLKFCQPPEYAQHYRSSQSARYNGWATLNFECRHHPLFGLYFSATPCLENTQRTRAHFCFDFVA